MVSGPFRSIYLTLKHSKLSQVSRIIRWVCAVRDMLYSGHYRWCVSLRDQASYQSNTLEYHQDFGPWCALQLKRMDSLFQKLNCYNASCILFVFKWIYFSTCKVLHCCILSRSITATVEVVFIYVLFHHCCASLNVLTTRYYAAAQRS